MSTLYLVFLIGVAVMLLGAVADAVIAVSRKPRWGTTRRYLHLVRGGERRLLQLPYVGPDRRQADEAADEEARKVA